MARAAGEIVIVGGGIIGCSIAYHLSELGVMSTVVEKCSVASAASGKAGGFLARSVHRHIFAARFPFQRKFLLGYQ